MEYIIGFTITVFFIFLYSKYKSNYKKTSKKDFFDKTKRINSILSPSVETQRFPVNNEFITSKKVFFVQPTPDPHTFLVGKVIFIEGNKAIILHCQNTSSPNIQIWRRTAFMNSTEILNWLKLYKVQLIKNIEILPISIIEESHLPKDVLRFADPGVARTIFNSNLTIIKDQYRDIK